jgi:membrane-bound serine protease (ClpP class)
MDLLFDPNLIYLLLAGGLIMAVLALAAPGTGYLELAALGVLALAGWGLAIQPQGLNIWAILLVFVGIGIFILSIRRPRQPLWLPLAIIALTIGSAYSMAGERWWQPAVHPLVAALVSILSAGFFWIAGRKVIEASHLRPAHEPVLVGQVGEAKSVVHKDGSVQVGGELWTAYSEQPIPRGARVRVIQKDGFRVKVEPLAE